MKYLNITTRRLHILIIWILLIGTLLILSKGNVHAENIQTMDDAGTYSIEGDVKNYISIKDITIDPIADRVYCGQEIRPDPVLSYQGETLVFGHDYTIHGYMDNVHAGTASVYVAGMGRFLGERKVTFRILPYDVSGLSDILKGTDGKIYREYYTGRYVCPKTKFRLKAIWNGQTVYLQPTNNIDYTYEYQNNKGIGEGAIVFTFKGNYTGTVRKRFLILPATPKLKSVKRKAKGRYLQWNKVKSCGYYEIYRKQSKNAPYKRIATVKKGCSYLDKKAPKKKTCYYRIVACKKQKKKVFKSEYSNEKKSR